MSDPTSAGSLSGRRIRTTATRLAVSAAIAAMSLGLIFELDGTWLGRYLWMAVGAGWFAVQASLGRPFTAEHRGQTILMTAGIDFLLAWVVVISIWFGLSKLMRLSK